MEVLQHMDQADAKHYQMMIEDLHKKHMLFNNTKILSISQYFLQDEYVGSILTCNRPDHISPFWIWMDPSWNCFVSEIRYCDVIMWLYHNNNCQKVFDYVKYGNFNNWKILDSGALNVVPLINYKGR